jgi:ATP-dependent Lhr-like helicase
VYPYLKENARVRLEIARHTARNTGMLARSLVHLGGYSWCLFPWLGTRSFRTCRKLIKKHAQELRISGIEYEGCCFITFKMEMGNGETFVTRLSEIVEEQGIDCFSLVESGEIPVFDKYDDCIPVDLLRRAYATDRLRADEVIQRIKAWEQEWADTTS